MRRKIAAGALAIAVLGAAASGYAWTIAGGSGPALPAIAVADAVLIEKSAHRLTLMSGGAVLKTYRISIGDGNPGAKRREGDGRTPEGLYSIVGRNPQSVAHLSLRISYPEPRDVAAAAAIGAPAGGDIMIHGIMNGFGFLGRLHRLVDWTDGCVAVTDHEMDEIWRAVPDGAPVEIRA